MRPRQGPHPQRDLRPVQCTATVLGSPGQVVHSAHQSRSHQLDGRWIAVRRAAKGQPGLVTRGHPNSTAGQSVERGLGKPAEV